MNQATNRRPPPHALLLLIPLLLANTATPLDAGLEAIADAGVETLDDGGVRDTDGGPPPPPVPLKVVFINVPTDLTAGGCTEVTLELRDPQGRPAAPLTVMQVGLSTSHGTTGVFHMGSSCDPLATTSEAVFSPGYSRATVWYRDTQAGSVTLTASSAEAGNASTGPVSIQPGTFRRIVVSPYTSTLAEACSEVKVLLKAEDAHGNVLPGGRIVRLCKAPLTASATIVSVGLESIDTSDPGCVRGVLPSAGVGYVVWSSPKPERVGFIPADTSGNQYTPLPAEWTPPTFSRSRSILFVRGSINDTTAPELRTRIGKLSVRFEPRDRCRNPIRLPSDQRLAFQADPPLVLGAPYEEADHRWTVDVSLPKCPDTPDALLSVWPTLLGFEVLDPNNFKIKQDLKPLCARADVKLSLSTEPQGLEKVAPGDTVTFMVVLENQGQELFAPGLLKFSGVDLTPLSATLGTGESLEKTSEGFRLPELRPGTTLTLKGQAQVAVQATVSAKATVWYVSFAGEALTDSQSLTFNQAQAGVDVGMGCQALPLSGSLLAGWALLMLVARSRARLGRVQPGERSDPPAP